MKHRAEIPSLETIRITAIFAGLSVGVQIHTAETGFACLARLLDRTPHPSLDKVRECIWSLGYQQIHERTYAESARWAPACRQALQSGMRDRELRRELYLHSELPGGISIAKLSFVLALLGQNLVCLDSRILDRMFGVGANKEYARAWSHVSELSLTRYEQVEDAFLRGNPFFRPGDVLGAARAQWLSWEVSGKPVRAESHAVWLNVVRGA